MDEELRVCSRCVLDTTVPEITFDSDGVCNYCKIHDALEEQYPLGPKGERRLNRLVDEIKKRGKNKDYDCVVGVSGGRDSTYTLHTAVQLGLRPLAVHFDNGWNSEIAVSNIKKATSKLGVDLHTVVADWEEFKDLQLSFLRASVPDAEVPTDYAIISLLLKIAADEGVHYAINGHSFRTEGTSPLGWTYMDGRYLKSVHKMFGSREITSFPLFSLPELLYHLFVKGIKETRLMVYKEYDQKEVDKVLSDELDWKYYGGHHHESVYTHFFQSYILPRKFNIDKRKTEYSALVRYGQMSREDALKKIRSNPYPEDLEIVDYCIKKLGITREEFDDIMGKPPKSFKDYPTYYPLIQSMKLPIKVACDLHLLPNIVYLKYAL